MTETTKDKIKKAAFELFAQKGYDGTSMSEIADCVGIKKASLYAHCSGKEDLLFAVFEDVAQKYRDLIDRLFKESENMGTEDRLSYIFEQYILYFYKNHEEQDFWNQATLFASPDTKKRFFPLAGEIESSFSKRMVEILEEGFDREVVRKGQAPKMFWSFRCISEGIINTIQLFPSFKEQWIKEFWKDLWLGLKNRGDENEKSQGV